MPSIVPPKISVLVVDDEPGLRTMLEIMLSREGYAVVTAPSYAVALEAISQAPQPFPVILTDRAVDSKDTSLYKSFLGSDFVKEGNKAGEWAVKEFADAKEVNIAELQGTTGSAPATDRKQGFTDVISKDPKFKITQSQTGEFTRAKGKEVMEAFLKSGKPIDLLFAHNDDMALGAIEAIEGAGKVPGKDIKIVSIDAVKDGMQALADGKINYIIECSPLLGPQLMDLAKKVTAGEEVPARIETEEGEFDQAQAKEALPTRQY